MTNQDNQGIKEERLMKVLKWTGWLSLVGSVIFLLVFFLHPRIEADTLGLKEFLAATFLAGTFFVWALYHTSWCVIRLGENSNQNYTNLNQQIQSVQNTVESQREFLKKIPKILDSERTDLLRSASDLNKKLDIAVSDINNKLDTSLSNLNNKLSNEHSECIDLLKTVHKNVDMIENKIDSLGTK